MEKTGRIARTNTQRPFQTPSPRTSVTKDLVIAAVRKKKKPDIWFSSNAYAMLMCYVVHRVKAAVRLPAFDRPPSRPTSMQLMADLALHETTARYSVAWFASPAHRADGGSDITKQALFRVPTHYTH